MDESIKFLFVNSEPAVPVELQEMMRALDLELVDVITEVQRVVEATQEHRPDIVLLNGEPAGIDSGWIARKIRHDFGTTAILLADFDDPDWIDEKVEAGLFHILIKPFTGLALYAKLRGVLAEQADRKRWENDRKVIDQAKGLLMQHCHLSESEAYGRLRRQSMHMHRTMSEVARDVIAAADMIFWYPPPSGRG